LVIVNGSIELHKGAENNVVVSCRLPIIANRWYSVVAVFRPSGVLLDAAPLTSFGTVTRVRDEGPRIAQFPTDELYLAAWALDNSGSPICPFNGKIEAPVLVAGPINEVDVGDLHFKGMCSKAPFASWTFGTDWDSEKIRARVGCALEGRIFNGAERAVTGHNWNGTSESFLAVPDQYNALQFHEDDMVDCGWKYDLEFDLPPDIASGIYAVKLQAGAATEFIPLFVSSSSSGTVPILFLVPTNTYLAYANDHLAAFDLSACMDHEKIVPDDEQELFVNPTLGRSIYDVHSDGTPVRYASRRRPLINVRPASTSWLTGSYRHFAVDLYLLEWLERLGIEYHVATDEDVDKEGLDLFKRYRVVVTGSHPEYWSGEGLDALKRYLSSGGRLMYLGGNGFYWVTSCFPDRPWVIEVRRDNSGTRCWDAPHGERMHASTSELGGMWRLRGLSPNKLVGVGFAAEGWGQASGYERGPLSYSGAGSAFFEGIQNATIGDRGFILDGAVGDEIDRFDISLGSPAHAEVLATSTPLGPQYQLVIEDQTLTMPAQDGVGRPDKVRADIVYFPIEGEGAVFSVGSIVYAGAMAWNNFDNDLARLTTNVVRCFALGDLPKSRS